MNKISLVISISSIIILIGSNATFASNFNFEKTMISSIPNYLIPQESWNKTFGGDNLDWGWSVKETADGGFIIAGETVSFGSGNYDSWLIKTDSNGNESWNRTFGGSAKDGSRSVQQTNDSGYILGGYADSYGYPGHDAWFIKTDNNGFEEWDFVTGGIASDGTFTVIQTSDEGYIGVGYADSYGSGSHDLWLVRTDKNGNEEWNKTYGTSEWDTGYSLKQCDDGGYIIIGTTQSYGSGGQDAWLIKTDMNGTEEWNKTYGGTNNDWGSAVIITDDGFFITGDTRSYGPGGYDIWLIKTDKQGNELWKSVYGESDSDDTGYFFIQTSDGGFAIIGIKTSFSTQLTDIWLIKTDDNGNEEWNITIDGGEDEWSYSVDETNDGGYIIVGKTNSYGNGNYDLWLIKVELVNYENQPPTAPNINGPKLGKVGKDYEYKFVSEDSEGNDIYYFIDWDDDTYNEWIGPFSSGEEAIISHAWSSEENYSILAKAKDTHGAESNWSEPYIVIIGNHPPNKPYIDGPKSGKTGKSYEYTFNTTDPDGDDIAEYFINWGDGKEEIITGPFLSGEEVTTNHTWQAKGTYTIRARAKDIFDAESSWSEFEVIIPRNKMISNSLFLQFLERFPLVREVLIRLIFLYR